MPEPITHPSDKVFVDTLRSALEAWEIPVHAHQLGQMHAHFLAVVEANRRMNLTRLTDPLEAAIKHYADSLAMLPWAARQRLAGPRVLDIGTGAGFPAFPLAIMRPDWQVTAIDGTGKKIAVVAQIAADLELPNLQAEHAHTSQWRPRRRFDIVTLRAVGRMSKCLTEAARFVAPRGHLVMYKTATVDAAEQADAVEVAADLYLNHELPHSYDLSLSGDVLHRQLHIYSKKERRGHRSSHHRHPRGGSA